MAELALRTCGATRERRDSGMRTVNEILRNKGHAVWSVGPDATVYDVLKLMDEKNLGAVLVMEGDCLVGLLSERDYARKVALRGRTSRDTLARDIMTERVTCVFPDQTAEECMALMTEKRVRHLPVLEGDRVVGIISIGDVVKTIIDEKQFIIDQLEHYITGSPYPRPK
jgi:predicted transcriptional regulator